MIPLPSRLLRVCTLLRTPLLALLLGCAGPDGTAGDDTADDTAGGPLSCADVPLVNYANFGEGFLLHYCQGCHASTTPDRYGAPEAVTFDTLEDAWFFRDRILDRAAVDPPTMPPAGATDEDDRTRLRWWLECAEEGT